MGPQGSTVRDFLTSRRAKITPESAGLTTYVDLARALRDRAAGERRRPARRTVRSSIEWMINAMTGAAAFVVNSRQDILAASHLGRAFYAPVLESPAPANMARFTYLDPRARDFFTDWSRTAHECVAALRTQAGRDPLDLSGLIGELSTQSEKFAALWATHDVRLHRKTEKNLNHPVAGDLALRYERLAVDGDPGLEIHAYIAEPGSRSAEAFNFLASYSDRGELPSRSSVKKDVWASAHEAATGGTARQERGPQGSGRPMATSTPGE